jgi:hypothetical protein
MDEREVARLQRRQCGVISRRQVLDNGGSDLDIARLVRRREWARVHEGVYVDHTGPLTRRQEEWAAVLLYDVAALDGLSALRAHGVEHRPIGRRDGVEVVVDPSRRCTDRPGVTVRQMSGFAGAVLLDASPPRLRLEHAALRVASGARSEDAAVALLADAVREGRTTSARLLTTLEGWPRLPRRRLLTEVLDDVGVGAESALERRYLRQVERAHCLPHGVRQVHESILVIEGDPVLVVRRDVRYPGQSTLVELDGVLGHAATMDRWADLDRDVVAAVRGSLTLRMGWQQVLQPRRLAVLVGAVLSTRGWPGRPASCGHDCLVRRARIA